MKYRDLISGCVCGGLILLGPATILAHDGEPHAAVDITRSWVFDPLVIFCLVILAVLYCSGLLKLWRAAGNGRGISWFAAAAFAAGWLSLLLALLSPLHPLGEVLFSAHMTQHEILMLVSAPLLALGRPQIATLWALPGSLRQPLAGIFSEGVTGRVWRAVSNPAVAWGIHAIALWIWHIPVLFQATLESDLVHLLQHASFFLSALLFWWAIIHGRRGMAGYGAGVLYLFTTSVQSGLLGVFLTLTTRVWYPAYGGSAEWNLTPLEDQQLGGLIMWVPAGIVYILAALFMFSAWLNDSGKRVTRRETAVRGTAAH